jgi:DNA-directed RNA polymerase specialized sigma24 family protein
MPARTAAKGRTAASKTKAKAAEKDTTRASSDELDKLAAQVVKLRDVQGKSWGEIEEALDVAPGRLRALYNRGGGEPTRKRQGKAAVATDKEGKSASKGRGKSGTTSKRRSAKA